MTNYNDGKWHGWNGGECPVHAESITDVVYDDGYMSADDKAGEKSAVRWTNGWKGRKIIAFRVIKEHKEPREFWVCYADEKVMIYSPEHDPIEYADFGFIHVREVTE